VSGTGAYAETVPAAGGAARQAAGLPRLLPPVPGTQEDLGAHTNRLGERPEPGIALIELAEQAGLTGRGGAAFPVHRKLAAVTQSRARKVVIGNAAESEPASRKDAALLWHAPHLVLDGLALVAEAVGASQVCLYLGHRDQHDHVAKALRDRGEAGRVQLVQAPPRFLAGQETALVNRVAGGPALPTFTPPLVPERGIAVHNVETLAHLALIARFGPRWFREAGTQTEPGTMLATIHQGGHPSVTEIEIGTPLHTLIKPGNAQAVLVGGYHGTWLKASALTGDMTLDNHALGQHNASLGAGVIASLPAGVCGLNEAARVTRYLAAESAGQCGPCLNGLPRIAAAMDELAGRKPRRKQREDTERWLTLVTGRGACHHPDGTARFVRGALNVFAGELRLHAKGQCSATSREPFLPLPSGMPSTKEDWL
jgi:NADH:ubiquinone oxidoreductase subunit F (NADH-binding)